MDPFENGNLFEAMRSKGSLKQDVYDNTLSTFRQFKECTKTIIQDFKEHFKDNEDPRVAFEFQERGEFEFEIKFAGDILIFFMHSNVFEFPRDHFVQKTGYIKEDKSRSYCGVINIFNFLADSFKYRRVHDVGYLIGRVFVNKDMHYYLEGKKEIGLVYNNFVNDVMDKAAAARIVKSAILYTINFDLLTPPIERIKEIRVADILSHLDSITLKTGKRLGFKFQTDTKEDE